MPLVSIEKVQLDLTTYLSVATAATENQPDPPVYDGNWDHPPTNEEMEARRTLDARAMTELQRAKAATDAAKDGTK